METKKLLNKKITQWLLLVAMLVGCSANALAYDIYVHPSDANHRMYAWDDKSSDGWPGDQFSSTSKFDKYGTWYCWKQHPTKSSQKIIFNNGGSSQTANLSVSATTYYYYTGGTSYTTLSATNKYYYSELYLDCRSFTDWTKDGAAFRAYFYSDTGCTDGEYIMAVDFSATSTTNVYKATFTCPIPIKGIKFERMNSDKTQGWNNFTINTFSSSYNCGKVTGYNAGSKTFYTACTTPSKSQYTMASQSVDYTGSAQKPTINVADGAGSITKIYGSTNSGSTWTDYGTSGPINAGTYMIKIDCGAGTTYCASTSSIVLDNTFKINKINQSALTFNGSTECVDTEVTLSATGGSSGETITYKKKSGTGTVTGNKLTTDTAGDVEVTATCPGGTNYNDVTADATFTFNPNASIGSVSLTDSEVTVGGSTSATASDVVLGGGTGSWSSSDESVATIASDGTISTIKKGTTNIRYTITGGCGTSPLSKQATLTVVTGCVTPTAGFTVNSDWNGAVFSDNHKTATLSTNLSVTNYAWYSCDSKGDNETYLYYNPTQTVTFTKPGTYYYKVKAGCGAANVQSEIKEIDVNFPEMRIEGPIATNGWISNYGSGSLTLDCDESTHTWSKEFPVTQIVAGNDAFRIGQYNKRGNGWTQAANGADIISDVKSTTGCVADGTYHFNHTIDGLKVGDRVRVTVVMNAYNDYSVSLVKTCTQPTTVDITGDWSGNFSDSNRSVDLSTSVETNFYQWYTCNSDGTGEQWVEGAYYKQFHREFTLPGKYYFKVKAGCTTASVSSAVKEVDVPFPAMRVEGIIVGGKWDDDYDKSEGCALDMDCNKDTYTWTKEFNAASGDTHAFRIGQENKKGAGWTNANADILGAGQTITTQGDCTKDGNYHFDQTISSPVLAATEKVKVTVTMNAYNNYTVKLERLCGKPFISTWTIPTSAVCEGTEHTIIAEFHSYFGPINSYDWSATGGWTPAQTHTEGYSNTFTAGSSNGTITVTAASRCDGSQSQEATSGSITTTPLPSLTLSGVGAKNAAATYPWEYMTVTATTDANLSWNDLVVPSGIGANDYVYETGATDNVKKLKSKQTANEDTDMFVISATATKSGCSTTKTYDVYINAAPAEVCQ